MMRLTPSFLGHDISATDSIKEQLWDESRSIAKPAEDFPRLNYCQCFGPHHTNMTSPKFPFNDVPCHPGPLFYVVLNTLEAIGISRLLTSGTTVASVSQ